MESPNELIKIKLKNGSACIHRYDDKLEDVIFTSLYVRKNRRSGTGNLIMRYAESISKSLGAKRILLRAEIGKWTHEWYERIGYKEVEGLDPENGLVWMEKKI